MATIHTDHTVMKDSPTYLPILRSVLKSQIQFLVEQLSDAGEETLLLSANVSDGQVEQLGSESGKLFVDVYDDFKSEFLGFCQRRKGKRKFESPQKTPVDVKRGKTAPAVLSIPKAAVQAVKSPQNVPKVSSARIIVSQKPASTPAKSVSQISSPGNQVIQVSAEQQQVGELGEAEEDFTEIEDPGLGYEELEDVQTWQGQEVEESSEAHSSSQEQVKTVSLPRDKVVAVTQNPNMIITSAGNMKTIRFEKSMLIKNTCMYCNKVFGSERDMKLHMRSHTGEKPYKCEMCESLFTLKRSLEKHVLKQHMSVLNVQTQNM